VIADRGTHITCPVCDSVPAEFGRDLVLGHVAVTYYRCSACGLVLLPEPTWLDEAYSEAISSLDVGLLMRSQRLARITAAVVRAEGLSGARSLDWAGGYGTLTRLLRDRGFDFRHFDPYCQNLFAKGLEGDLSQPYDLVTAYEVVEHLPRPLETLGAVSDRTDRLLFSTYLLPDPAPRPGEWWYYAPESGQHVTFHTRRSLEILAERLGYQLASDGELLHLFHRGDIRRRTRILLSPGARRARNLARRVGARVRRLGRGRASLVDADFASAVARICAGPGPSGES